MGKDTIYGINAIAKALGMSVTDTVYLLRRGGIPYVTKVKRVSEGEFYGGGRGVWAIEADKAEAIRHTRRNTPLYDPKRASEALVEQYKDTGCTSVDELINMGYITDLDWCAALNKEREISNLHIAILMHPRDFAEYMAKKNPTKVTKADVLVNTTNIFKPIRKKRS